MAVKEKVAKPQGRPVGDEAPRLDRLARLLRGNRPQLTIAAGIVVLIGGAIWFTRSAQERREAFAARALQDAKAAIAAGNLPLAANDLSRLVSSYRGTTAAGEAVLLLAQIRLNQQQADQAIEELNRYLSGDPPERFKAAGYSLLGAAYEQVGRMAEAARAYEVASGAWPYVYLKAQLLLDAARAYRLGGDTATAAAAYERILRDFPEAPSALEAKLRLGELRPSGPGA